MSKRFKQVWFKPFKFVDTKKTFDQLDTNDQSLIIVIPTQQPKPVAPHKKQEIPVPKIDTVQRATEVKSFAKITPNYIRLPNHLNLPIASNYQLNEVDHTFLKSHQERFYFNGKKLLTSEFMRRAFVELELKAGKDMTLPRNKGWLLSFLEREYKDFLQMDNIETFADIVYNYWKNRRQELKFPLLRLLWKPNPDEYNHMLAFRPRQRDKRSLRRTNRVVQDQIIQELYQEFDLTLKIVDRVQMREDLRFKQIQLQMMGFYNQCKSLCPQPQFVEDVKFEQRAKDKEKMKGMHNSLDNYKNRKESLQNTVTQDAGTNQVDNKLSMVNFLSTVVAQCELLGLSYERMFYSGVNNSSVNLQKSQIPTNQLILEQVPSQIFQQELKNPQEYLGISLSRYDDMLIRTFDSEIEPVFHIKPSKDFLQMKRRKIDRYYFGSDDEGQIKDLRKNISASFKKFQQLQQLTRTFSAVSQNN